MRLTLISLLFLAGCFTSKAQYPEGVAEEIIYSDFSYPAGMLFANDSVSFVYELDGRVWSIINEEVLDEPLVNISEEVGFWGDHGLISAVLHPDFSQNGYIYLLYNVDRHYLLNFGTPNYDPEISEEYKGGMGRVTRYEVNLSSFSEVETDSRQIILGNEIGEGIPIAAQSHGIGTIMFGEDGSLLISTGDVNSYICCYNGDGPVPQAAYDSLSYQDGILRADELIGAFRSQYLNSLNGKVLRIHPETGEGIANNPFFNGNASSAKSKIWALGFRNPFRMTIRPNTGGGNIENGFPGIIYLSDVGESRWEELNIISEPGKNYGWPIYEGNNPHELGYPDLLTYNTTAENPIFDGVSCVQPYFSFQDLILQENQQHVYNHSNPCDINESIPDEIETFYHSRPTLAYKNFWLGEDLAVVPSFDELGNATSTLLSDFLPGEIDLFRGNSGAAGVFLNGDNIPLEYQNTLVFPDYSGWLRNLKFDENQTLENIELWSDTILNPIHITQSPFDQCLYISTLFPSYIKRICFGGNLKPVIVATPITSYGTAPLEITFDAGDSYDPEGTDLSFEWDFGDGNLATGAIVSHTFVGTAEAPEPFNVLLTVHDADGFSRSKDLLVSLNNTAPQVEIASIQEGELYGLESPTLFDLIPVVDDAEHSPDEMSYAWTYLLHHNEHFHLVDRYEFQSGQITVNPTGCNEAEYWYEIILNVTDPAGLSNSASRNIYPDCEGFLLPHSGENKINLFPNPASESLTVKSVKPFSDNLSIRIISSEGKEIRSESIPIYNSQVLFVLQIEELPHGVYILEVTDGNEIDRLRFLKY